jgi:hypothetical protein
MKLDVSVATTLLFLSLLNSGAFYIHHKLSLNLFTFYFASSVHFLTLFCMCRSIGRSANRHFIGERSLHAQCYLRTKHATKNILFQCTVHFSSPDIQHFGRVVGFIGALSDTIYVVTPPGPDSTQTSGSYVFSVRGKKRILCKDFWLRKIIFSVVLIFCQRVARRASALALIASLVDARQSKGDIFFSSFDCCFSPWPPRKMIF